MFGIEQKIYVLFYHDRTMITNNWTLIKKKKTMEEAKKFVQRKRKNYRYEVRTFGGKKEVTMYRYRIVFLLLLLMGSLQAQNKLMVGLSAFLSGAADGVNQAILFHYDKGWKPVHPNANDQFWNPDISWKNKYKDWPNDTRARFPFSKTAFVSLTDGYHLTRTLDRKFLGAAITYNFSGDRREHWYQYVIETLGIFLVRSLGFHLTYTIIYG